MSHTYYQLLYHLVWSTKNREPTILPEFKDRLHNYLGGTFRGLECQPIVIGGMPDHIHILVAIPPKLGISEIIRNTKVSSSKWVQQMKDQFPNSKLLRHFSWQEGYGAFSVSMSQMEKVKSYIENQEEHHQKRDFRSEFLSFLIINKIPFEEKYLWK